MLYPAAIDIIVLVVLVTIAAVVVVVVCHLIKTEDYSYGKIVLRIEAMSIAPIMM